MEHDRARLPAAIATSPVTKCTEKRRVRVSPCWFRLSNAFGSPVGLRTGAGKSIDLGAHVTCGASDRLARVRSTRRGREISPRKSNAFFKRAALCARFCATEDVHYLTRLPETCPTLTLSRHQEFLLFICCVVLVCLVFMCLKLPIGSVS